MMDLSRSTDGGHKIWDAAVVSMLCGQLLHVLRKKHGISCCRMLRKAWYKSLRPSPSNASVPASS
jgi:hypothetical protein